MLCTHHLGSPFKVGSHYFREYFIAQDYEVLYLSAPITLLHILKFNEGDVRKRIQKCFRQSQELQMGELVPFSLLAPDSNLFLNSKFVIKNWHLTSSNTYKTIVKQKFNKPDILYIDNIFYAFLLAKLNPNKIIFRVMDKHDGFPGWKDNIFSLAQKISKNSDLVIYTAKNLKPYVNKLQANLSKYIPNGIDLKLYSEVLPKPDLYKSLQGLIAVYVGSLDKWFNYEWILNAAKSLTNISFIIIGPIEAKSKKFEKHQNIKFLGAIKNDQIIPFLQWADVGLIPFYVKEYDDLIKTVNPIKLYEYAAAGLPAISSKWDSKELLDSDATLVETYSEFENALKLIEKGKKVNNQSIEKHDWSQILELNLQPFLDANSS